MLCGNDVCEGWNAGLVMDGLVVDCGLCGVQDFCVVSGFVAKDLPEALCMEGIESVGLWLCEGGRFHTIGEHGYEGGFVDSEFPLCVEVAVAPEKVEFGEGSSGFGNSGGDICVGGAVLPDVDSQVLDL